MKIPRQYKVSTPASDEEILSQLKNHPLEILLEKRYEELRRKSSHVTVSDDEGDAHAIVNGVGELVSFTDSTMSEGQIRKITKIMAHCLKVQEKARTVETLRFLREKS